MKLSRLVVVLALTLMLTPAMSALAGSAEEETHTFDNVDQIRVNTISGDCVVRRGPSAQIEVEVSWDYWPEDSFEPVLRQRDDRLILSEEMYGSNSGRSTWTITAPEGIDIRFSSASGGLEIYEMSGDFRMETASGDLSAERCGGDFEFSTASGDLEMTDCKGQFDISTASGSIDLFNCEGDFDCSTASGSIGVDGVVITDRSSFSTASGRVAVGLGATCEYDLEVSTASGRAVLDYGGHELQGTFEFTAKERKGRIISPIDFDDEEYYRRWGDEYVRRWFSRGNERPVISIGTATGRAELIEG